MTTRRDFIRQSSAASLVCTGLMLPLAGAHAQSLTVPPGRSAAAGKLSVKQIGDCVATQILELPELGLGYTYDIQLEALLSWGEASGQSRYLEFVRQAYQDRKYPISLDPLNYRLQLFSCLPFELYKRFASPGLAEPFVAESWRYRREALRTYDGLASYYFPELADHLNALWTPILIDNSQEYASRMAKAGVLSGDASFRSECVDQFARLRRAMWDPATGLWNHGRGWQESLRTVTTTKWGRGQAWMLRGLIESLTYLPHNTSEHGQIAKMLDELAASLLRYQDEEGFWRQVVDRPDSYQETSATAFISHYFARAVRQGLLPDGPYRASSIRAFEALTRTRISSEGTVYGACERTPPFMTVEAYLQRKTPVNDHHGVATALLAAAGQMLLEAEYSVPWIDRWREGALSSFSNDDPQAS